MEKYRSVLIMGPPGSGKGTLGKSLATFGGHFHLSSGELFRDLGVVTCADAGGLVSDDVVGQVWLKHMVGLISLGYYNPSTQLLLLDGIPRTREQAFFLSSYIDVKGVIILQVDSVDILFCRIKNRGKAEGRPDDGDYEVVRRRLAIWQEETCKVVDWYNPDLVLRVDASQKTGTILIEVLSKFATLLLESEK